MGALDDQDGTLRLFWPDDLYLFGSRAALVSLRDAINQALSTGYGLAASGPLVEGEMRAVQVIRFEPLDSKRSPYLPLPEPVWMPTSHSIPPRQERAQPMRAPVLAGVLPEYG